ncbi:hypothetical protein [Cereibacter sphaeroides]|uniref:hypothetical protein n=1 Tax=Cereibacter sphaeroides TaxID=1063 RepID=UPI003FCD7304
MKRDALADTLSELAEDCSSSAFPPADTLTCSAGPWLRPFGGWALRAAFEIEQRSGIRLLAPLFAADDLRRAAVFSALAAWYDPGSEYRHLLSDVTATEFAQWLLAEDPAEIARILDEGADEPLTRLARLGSQPLAAAEHYRSSMLFGARTVSAGEAKAT